MAKTLINLENQLSYTGDLSETNNTNVGYFLTAVSPIFYFCIPRNDKMLDYWDIVEDRLFKIRHCMNIEGNISQPPQKTGLIHLLSAKNKFSKPWQNFLNPSDTEEKQTLELNLSKTLFPHRFRTIDSIDKTIVFLKLNEEFEYTEPLFIIITPPGMIPSDPKELIVTLEVMANLPYTEYQTYNAELGKWLFEVNRTVIPESLRQKTNGAFEIVKINGIDHYRLNTEAIDEWGIIIEYSATLR